MPLKIFQQKRIEKYLITTAHKQSTPHICLRFVIVNTPFIMTFTAASFIEKEVFMAPVAIKRVLDGA